MKHLVFRRNRTLYIFLIILVILLGLGSRHFSSQLPFWVHDYAGDALWALMVFLGIGFLFTKWSSVRTCLAALAFSYFIEITQLYHAPWIDAIRRTTLGGLILGYGFLWSDLLCYTAGVFLGLIFEMIFYKIKRAGD